MEAIKFGNKGNYVTDNISVRDKIARKMAVKKVLTV